MPELTNCGNKDDVQISVLGEQSVKLNNIEYTHSINDAQKFIRKLNENSIDFNCDKITDGFISPDGKGKIFNAPILLFEQNNTVPFTFSAKISPGFAQVYDAGCLYIYTNPEYWQKLAFEMDENKLTRIVTVRTMNTSDDNNHEAIDQEYVYVKISSDTRQIGFYYSRDNVKWNLARIYKNDYPEKIWLGISSQSPTGNGTHTVFDEMSITETAVSNFRLGL